MSTYDSVASGSPAGGAVASTVRVPRGTPDKEGSLKRRGEQRAAPPRWRRVLADLGLLVIVAVAVTVAEVVKGGPPDQTVPVRPRWRRILAGATLPMIASIAIALVVAMAELDKIIGSVVVGAASHTVASIQMPFQSPNAVAAAFNDWEQAARLLDIRHWITVQWWLDLAFILAYTAFLWGLRRRWGLVSAGLIYGLAVADAVEDVLGLILTSRLPAPGE